MTAYLIDSFTSVGYSWDYDMISTSSSGGQLVDVPNQAAVLSAD